MAQGKDLYAVLGVAKDASADEIRKTYRKLAKQLHPDVNPAGEERFKEVSAAYAVLSDADKRALYDEFGELALQANFDKEQIERLRRFGGGGAPFDFQSWSSSFAAGGGLEELLGGLFGGRFGGGGGFGGFARGPRRGRDVEAELKIDLPLSVRGGTTTIQLLRAGRERAEVKIPPGVRDGQALRLAGLGEPGQMGAPAGDLIVHLKLLEHPSYRREGDDLHVEVPVTLAEAIRGGKVSFEGPTGEVSIKLPPGTQSGQSFRLRGLGARKEGNLYARVVIASPPADGSREEARQRELAELAEKLEAFYPQNPRDKVRF
ncbi:MAG: DnaJ C-terminal domain-containing protein [Planctomycetota bacterium]